eukprot:gene6844-30822_t
MRAPILLGMLCWLAGTLAARSSQIPSQIADRSTLAAQVDVALSEVWVAEMNQPQPPSCLHPPCLAFVGLHSHAKFIRRRQQIRDSYQRWKIPGLDFGFILAIPAQGVGPGLLTQSEKDSWQQEHLHHSDMVMLDLVEEADRQVHKSFAFFAWAAAAWPDNSGYRYMIKADDDLVVNPFQLSLQLHLLAMEESSTSPPDGTQSTSYPHEGGTTTSATTTPATALNGSQTAGVYWGNKCKFGKWMNGAMYGISSKLSGKLALGIDSMSNQGTWEDINIGTYMLNLVPYHEWKESLTCQFTNIRAYQRLPFFWYSSQMIGIHEAKSVREFNTAFQAMRPDIIAMQEDCKEMVDAQEKGMFGADIPPICRRWNGDSCRLSSRAMKLNFDTLDLQNSLPKLWFGLVLLLLLTSAIVYTFYLGKAPGRYVGAAFVEADCQHVNLLAGTWEGRS